MQPSNVLLELILLFNIVSCEDLSCSREEKFRNDFETAFNVIQTVDPSITDDTDLADWNVSNIGVSFDCDLYENPRSGPPSTVHELTPYDINVVAAMGDSITAAFGANSHTIEIVEFRGVSWSIGGDETLETVATLPNIIKKYNPNVKGFSVGTGDASSANSSNNVAISGGVVQDMPSQAQSLVDKIKADPDVENENDWKVITLFIGGNNLCKYCLDEEFNSVRNYYKNLNDALSILHSELPKTFVNLVLIMDVTLMAALKTTPTCIVTHTIACPCERRQSTSEVAKQYQKAVQFIVNSERFEKDDFTIVIQPMFIEMEIPTKDDGSGEPDHSYFAPDCFHFSGKGHKEAAVALWNNMVFCTAKKIQSIGSKQRKWEINGSIVCPTETSPYFYTNVNSEPVAVAAVPNSIQGDDETTKYNDEPHGQTNRVGVNKNGGDQNGYEAPGQAQTSSNEQVYTTRYQTYSNLHRAATNVYQPNYKNEKDKSIYPGNHNLERHQGVSRANINYQTAKEFKGGTATRGNSRPTPVLYNRATTWNAYQRHDQHNDEYGDIGTQANYKDYQDKNKQSSRNKYESDNNHSNKNKYQGNRDPANVDKN